MVSRTTARKTPASRADDLKTFDGLAPAAVWFAAQLDTTPAKAKRLLQKAKKAGLPGFRNSRVHADELLPALKAWLAGQTSSPAGQESKDELECRRLRAQCERIERENQEAKGELIALSTVEAMLSELGSSIMVILRQKLENEWPISCAGLEPAQIRVRGKALVDDLAIRLQKAAAPWQSRHE